MRFLGTAGRKQRHGEIAQRGILNGVAFERFAIGDDGIAGLCQLAQRLAEADQRQRCIRIKLVGAALLLLALYRIDGISIICDHKPSQRTLSRLD